jgi:hypothetical protein
MSSELKPLFSDSIQKGGIVGEWNNRTVTKQRWKEDRKRYGRDERLEN